MGKTKKMKSSANQDSFPLIRWTKLGGNPPPISNKGKYVKRIVKIDTADGESVTNGKISVALGHAGDFVITMCRCWAVLSTTAGTGTNIAFNAFPQWLLSNSGTSSDALSVSDLGTFSSRAAVKFEIPRSHALISEYDVQGDRVLFAAVGAGATFYVTCWQYAA